MKWVRVTEALSPWNSFEGIPEAVLNNAAERGTRWHHAAAAHCQGLYTGKLDDDIIGFFDSFRRWFDKWVDHVYWTEKELTNNELCVVGHADAGICMTDNRNVVFDWKTALQASKTWGPQAAAYLWMADYKCDEDYSECAIFQPKKDGGIGKTTVFKKSQSASDLAVFISAVNCYRYFKGGE